MSEIDKIEVIRENLSKVIYSNVVSMMPPSNLDNLATSNLALFRSKKCLPQDLREKDFSLLYRSADDFYLSNSSGSKIDSLVF